MSLHYVINQGKKDCKNLQSKKNFTREPELLLQVVLG